MTFDDQGPARCSHDRVALYICCLPVALPRFHGFAMGFAALKRPVGNAKKNPILLH